MHKKNLRKVFFYLMRHINVATYSFNSKQSNTFK